jgi:SAM-dependent methyltransferase
MPEMTRSVREQAEIQRSSVEASLTDLSHLIHDPADVARYLAPPADTWYPLEYAFHLLGDVTGKTVLEYGCGNGINTLFLAHRGARVIALDISRDLVEIARQRVQANGLASRVEFIVGSGHDLPLADSSVDVVFGIAILHHLDLAVSAREVKRVLRGDGRAIFQEPVRNSKLIKRLRPLILYRAADVSPFEYPLTDEQIRVYAEGFRLARSRYFHFPTTDLINVIPFLRSRYWRTAFRLDALLLRRFPFLRRWASVNVVEMVRSS